MAPAPRNRQHDPKAPLPADTGLDLTFEAVDLVHRIGTQRRVERTVASDTQVGDAIYGVAPGTDIAVEASLESVEEGIFVHGSADTTLTGECSRCLDPVSEHLRVDFNELFTYPDKVPAELDDEEIPILEGDDIDLAQLVHDSIALAAPLQPLCRDDCPGLCPQCGFRMEDDPTHEHTVIDPRFAQLASLLEDAAVEEEK